jgi:FlaA1/EpsC-like NDP-sugar epimerase
MTQSASQPAAEPAAPTASRRTTAWTVARTGRYLLVVDIVAWAVALTIADALRHDFHLDYKEWKGLAIIVPIAFVVQSIVGFAIGLYRGRWRTGSFDEVSALVTATAASTIVILLADIALQQDTRPVPLSACVSGGIAALVFMGGFRYSHRVLDERNRRPSVHATRVVVFGAGEGGARAVRAMLTDKDSPYLPVALVDDDPDRRNLSIMNVPVVGDRHRIKWAARALGCEALIIAVPSADAALIGELVDIADETGLMVRVLPSVRELFGADIRISDIRELSEDDLLGRHKVETDMAAIAHYLTGKRVLVTGAGGSIGAELCQQIYRFAPSELIMVDRDESALHAIQLSLHGRALLDTPDLLLVDIRDRRRVHDLFLARRPEVVFHAAALKHLPLLEQHPVEALKSNVWGTLSVLDAARAAGVERFVNISTDKAANPVSNLGCSKRVTERLTAWMAEATAEGIFLSVRFGNVLGSRGSVLTAFRAQIEAGGPITVTDPDVTRYFMTVEEAVQLVIQAGAIGRDGEALVLDMGDPVRIADVARRLALRARRPIEIVYTGLRPGEKLHEDLFGDDEVDTRPAHPMISHVPVPPLDPALVRDLDPLLDRAALTELLRQLAVSGLEHRVVDLTTRREVIDLDAESLPTA